MKFTALAKKIIQIRQLSNVMNSKNKVRSR